MIDVIVFSPESWSIKPCTTSPDTSRMCRRRSDSHRTGLTRSKRMRGCVYDHFGNTERVYLPVWTGGLPPPKTVVDHTMRERLLRSHTTVGNLPNVEESIRRRSGPKLGRAHWARHRSSPDTPIVPVPVAPSRALARGPNSGAVSLDPATVPHEYSLEEVRDRGILEIQDAYRHNLTAALPRLGLLNLSLPSSPSPHPSPLCGRLLSCADGASAAEGGSGRGGC